MGQVTLRVNGRNYDIACDDGQEPHLLDLADYLDRRVRELAATVGQIGESRLLVMASLLIADELYDLNGRLGQDGGKSRGGAAANGESATAEVVGEIAKRLDSLAARYQGA